MKIILTTALYTLFFLHPTYAKFSNTIHFIPCHLIKVKISHCEQKKLSNKTYLKERKIDLKKWSYALQEFSGALITAQNIETSPTKCHPKQKIRENLYKKLTVFPKKYFINKTNCKKLKKEKIIQVVKENFYCDTPGAMSIKSCFLKTKTFKESFWFTHLYPRANLKK